MTFEEKQIKAIRGATSDLKELNDKLDTILPQPIQKATEELIAKYCDREDVDSIYKYLCKNYDVMNMSWRDIINLISNVERCGNCNEWNKQDDINDNAYYGKRVCPTCIRNV
jgi:hypothetical protein